MTLGGHKYKLFYAGLGRHRVEQICLTCSDNLTDWYPAPTNPIIPVGPDGAFDSTNTSNPFVTKIDDLYQMVYQAKDAQNRIRFGLARSTDLINWTKSQRPFFEIERDDWREGKRNGCHHPHLVEHDGVWNLYYVFQNGSRTEIRMSVTGDLRTFGDPVVCLKQERSWESSAVYYPWVMRFGHEWVMWYSAVQVGKARWALARAISTDGVCWERSPDRPLEVSSPRSAVLRAKRLLKTTFHWRTRHRFLANPCIIRDAGEYRMFYQEKLPERPLSIGWARSPDGISWSDPHEKITKSCWREWEERFDADPFVLVERS